MPVHYILCGAIWGGQKGQKIRVEDLGYLLEVPVMIGIVRRILTCGSTDLPFILGTPTGTAEWSSFRVSNLGFRGLGR